MSISLNEVKRIASLARIAVSDVEAEAARAQLDGIFGLIEEMQAVDAGDIEPMSHAQEIVLRLRNDAVTEVDQHEAFQKGAPEVEAGLYLVPQVIE
ncbi:MAG: Asp-tRNA(Asn)/Glu-tRNA(Gln) amidotransferase subunit GatC [Burkholderiales bacterium]|nr:Asp-tRNA(Asn)/Glu-tRNA(Gln) amidotransferase subunit GatC [Burkholderiales bacterium]